MPQYKAFTVEYPSLASSLRPNCAVCQGASLQELQNGLTPPMIELEAVWDTGAEMSSVSHRVVQALNLKPISKAKNYTAAGVVDVYVYVINLHLPMGVGVALLPVTGNDLGDVDMLIGMDVINKGDFAVTNVGGKTTFSFRIPSIETIDYLATDDKGKALHAPKIKKPGRNDPCPCGSGKKYKNCHGKK